MLKICLLLLLCASGLSIENSAIKSGQQQYEVIQRDSQMPKYGVCWTEALHLLERGCSQLNDQVQSRLALNFANCFLHQAGQRTYLCGEKEDIATCLRGIDSNAFSAYSNFFTHTQNMCQFLQQQIWHQETESAIYDLTKTSSDVAKSLQNSSELQENIISNQLETLAYQKEIAEHGTLLSQSMEQSRQHVKDLMKELRASTDEQKSMIFSIFDRVTKLQSMLLSEVSWLYTILFYGACLLFIYIATSSKRTEDARLYLIMIVSANAFLERVLCDFTLEENGHLHEDILLHEENDLQALLHSRIWTTRKCAIFVSTLVLAYKAFTFQDYNRINFQLLQDIKSQNAELKKAVKMIKEGNLLEGKDALDSFTKGDEAHDEADDEQSEDDEDCLSYVSTQTDNTWQQIDKLSSDEEDFDDNMSENEEDLCTTPTNNNKDQITELTPVLSSTLSTLETKKKRGRTPSSRNSSRSTTPLRQNQSHNYNLRVRKQNQSFNGFDKKESADDFGKLVSKLAKDNRRCRKSLIGSLTESSTQNNKKMHVISEDDE